MAHPPVTVTFCGNTPFIDPQFVVSTSLLPTLRTTTHCKYLTPPPNIVSPKNLIPAHLSEFKTPSSPYLTSPTSFPNFTPKLATYICDFSHNHYLIPWYRNYSSNHSSEINTPYSPLLSFTPSTLHTSSILSHSYTPNVPHNITHPITASSLYQISIVIQPPQLHHISLIHTVPF